MRCNPFGTRGWRRDECAAFAYAASSVHSARAATGMIYDFRVGINIGVLRIPMPPSGGKHNVMNFNLSINLLNRK